MNLEESVVDLFGSETFLCHEFDQNSLLLLVWRHASGHQFVNLLRDLDRWPI